jgi:hypothetical protein
LTNGTTLLACGSISSKHQSGIARLSGRCSIWQLRQFDEIVFESYFIDYNFDLNFILRVQMGSTIQVRLPDTVY